MKVLKKSDLSNSSGFDRMVLIYSDFSTTTVVPPGYGTTNTTLNHKYKYWQKLGNMRRLKKST